ncbi:MAG: hypothetical protein JO223_14575 [Hyphomicrobiales bacterium]|nr:hypothetical protein [Hyphomicrobiales bacterium]
MVHVVDYMVAEPDREDGDEVGLRANDAKALLIAALDGFGIAFIAEDLAREGLRSGRLTKVFPDYETPSRPIHLIHHPDRRQSTESRSPSQRPTRSTPGDQLARLRCWRIGSWEGG